MPAPPATPDAATQFAAEAKASGLVTSSARPFNVGLAAIVAVSLALASVGIGEEAGWFNLRHGLQGVQLPACNGQNVSLALGTEANGSIALAPTWAALTSAYGNATGGCLRASQSVEAAGYSGLTGLSVDTVVGPSAPSAADGTLAANTYDVPLLLSGEVVIYNDSGIGSTLNLSGDALAGAYLGTVTNWSAPQIATWNPWLTATGPLTAAYIAGSSSANALFSTYVSEWNATFNSTVGHGPAVTFPAGVPVASPTAMLDFVASTTGAIGYEPTNLCPALPAGVACARIESAYSEFATPSVAGVWATANLTLNLSAASTGNWSGVVNVAPIGTGGYPMVSITYAVLYKDLGTSYGSLLAFNQSKWLIGLLFWVATYSGTALSTLLSANGYVGLPGGLAAAAGETDFNVTYNGNWILFPPGGEESSEGGGGETGEF